MSVRIISGSLRGRILKNPVGKNTRPTTDMWRSALFSALEHHADIEGATVLDLCCGTGAFGFECLSRGAARAVFVDADQGMCKSVKASAIDLGVEDKCEIHNTDLFQFLRTTKTQFDIIFTDPPYALKCCNKIASWLNGDMARNDNVNDFSLFTFHSSLIIFEHSATEALLPHSNLERVWYKESSRTVVEMYRRQAPKP